MQILSHRGLWKYKLEQNTLKGFESAYKFGFGIETDVRDFNSELVISHDIPQSSALKFPLFCAHYKQQGDNLPLALNIKSDGLQQMLLSALQEHGISNYFVFDSSTPDSRIYIKMGVNFFARQSEYESEPIFYADAKGVWLDQFNIDWVHTGVISEHLSRQKGVAVVSPELHGREHLPFWERLKDSATNNSLMLCTDFAEKAQEFFGG